MIWTLAMTAAGSALAAGAFGVVAWTLWERPASGEPRRALRAFAAYWAATGAYQALASVQHALAAAGVAPFAFEVAVRYAGLALACAGLAGLLYYFAYLRTGNRAWLRPIVATYALALVAVWTHVTVSHPIGVALTPWSVDLAYAGDFNGGLLFAPLLLLLLGVPAAAAAWYVTLARRMTDARQRYRVFAVGAGVGIQLFSFLVARLVGDPLMQLVSRVVVAAGTALLILSAYAPRAGSTRRAVATEP